MKLVIIMENNQKFIGSAGGAIKVFINQISIFFCKKKKKRIYLTDSKREIQRRKKLWLYIPDSGERDQANLDKSVKSGILNFVEPSLWDFCLSLPFLSNISYGTWENFVNGWSWLASHLIWGVNYEHIAVYYSTWICVFTENTKA